MNKSASLLLCVLAMLLAAGLAIAKPAPWFKWRSKLDGAIACSQTPLGPGWEKADGPYLNPACSTRQK